MVTVGDSQNYQNSCIEGVRAASFSGTCAVQAVMFGAEAACLLQASLKRLPSPVVTDFEIVATNFQVPGNFFRRFPTQIESINEFSIFRLQRRKQRNETAANRCLIGGIRGGQITQYGLRVLHLRRAGGAAAMHVSNRVLENTVEPGKQLLLVIQVVGRTEGFE